jgi:hypothetical protein
MVNFKIKLLYMVFAIPIVLVFGEIMPIFIANNPTFIQHPIAITIYYLLITFIFSLFIFRISPLAVVMAFFCFGVIAEMLVFGNIRGPTDLPGILFFGIQYIALFGTPYLITKRVLKKKR